jgi:hypothetical protein
MPEPICRKTQPDVEGIKTTGCGTHRGPCHSRNTQPDNEGIETEQRLRTRRSLSQAQSDSEGIETCCGCGSSTGRDSRNTQPDNEGIETRLSARPRTACPSGRNTQPDIEGRAGDRGRRKAVQKRRRPHAQTAASRRRQAQALPNWIFAATASPPAASWPAAGGPRRPTRCWAATRKSPFVVSGHRTSD